MRFSFILGIILIIIGLLGALDISAFFFGVFTVGLTLIICDFKRKEKPWAIQPQIEENKDSTTMISCLNCGRTFRKDMAFCPRCGEKVMKE